MKEILLLMAIISTMTLSDCKNVEYNEFELNVNEKTESEIGLNEDAKKQTEIKSIKPTEILKDDFREILMKYCSTSFSVTNDKYVKELEDLYADFTNQAREALGIRRYDISDHDEKVISEYVKKIYTKYADFPMEELLETGDGTAFKQVNLYTASSMLKPYASIIGVEGRWYPAISYSSQNLENMSYDNAWIEGKEGYGIGEKIEILSADISEGRVSGTASPTCGLGIYGDFQTGFSFSNYVEKEYGVQGYSHTLNGILIINGYAKSEESYKKNSRVKKLKLTIDDKKEYILELEDTMNPQLFDIGYTQELDKESLKPVKAEFEILEVYEGEEFEDTAITTIRMNVTRNDALYSSEKLYSISFLD